MTGRPLSGRATHKQSQQAVSAVPVGIPDAYQRKEVIGRAADRITAIYALCEPDHTPRYVGKTVRYLHERHKQHIYEAQKRRRLPVHRWLSKRIAEEKHLVIKLLEYVPAGENWAARETAWINQLRGEGFDLLNLTQGGEGLPGLTFTPEHREKIARGLRTGSHFECETCGANFWRKKREIALGNNRFCSRPCYAASRKGIARPLPAIAIERGVKSAAAAKRARPDCKRGHPLSGDNLFRTSNGSRGCKECRKIHKSTYRSKARG